MSRIQAIAVGLGLMALIGVGLGVRFAWRHLSFPSIEVSVKLKSEPEAESETEARATPIEPRLGLHGFCPVTVVVAKRWQQGNPIFESQFAGHRYYFINKEAQDAFLKSPTEYAPVLAELDIVSMVDEGKAQVGSARYGMAFRKRIYLFASPENRAKFEQDFKRYAEKLVEVEAELPGLVQR